MENQLVATFFYGPTQREINVYGCADEDTPEGTFDFYDIFDDSGECLNEGNPFYHFPTWFEVGEFVTL